MQILDVYYANKFNAAMEKSIGTGGVIIKGGQGEWPEYLRKNCDYVERAEDVGLPWGIYWQMDARYSPEGHKRAIKELHAALGSFGNLGLWLACELPYYPMSDFLYWRLRYAGWQMVESVWRGIQAYTGDYPGIYTSVSKWQLIFGKAPIIFQQELAERARLWTAQYGVISPTRYGKWERYTFWQHREGPDYSIFNGTEEEYRQEFGIGQTIPTPPPPVPVPTPPPAPVPAPTPGVVEVRQMFGGAAVYSKHVVDTPRPITYHVMRVDLSKFDIVLDDRVAVASTTNFVKNKKVQIAVNGLDGFYSTRVNKSWLTYLAGWNLYHGRAIAPCGKPGQEQSLYISLNNVFTLERPPLLWNVVSFPNLLVKGGIIQRINKSLDDIRARTAVGVTRDQKTLILLCVDGGDYWVKKGMNFVEVAAVMLEMGCDLAVMADGGGSTTMVADEGMGPKILNAPCGENVDKQRSVAVHFGLRLR